MNIEHIQLYYSLIVHVQCEINRFIPNLLKTFEKSSNEMERDALRKLQIYGKLKLFATAL
jgi:hypothetical protein